MSILKIIYLLTFIIAFIQCSTWHENEPDEDNGLEGYPSEKRHKKPQSDFGNQDWKKSQRYKHDDFDEHDDFNPEDDQQWPDQDEKYSPQTDDKYKQQQQRQGKSEDLQYDYRMESLVGTTNDKQRGGFKMEARVQFKRLSPSTCIFKLKSPKTSKLNGDYNQNGGNFESVSLDAKTQNLLSLPVKFNCPQGQIRQPVFDGEDVPWSSNIKRGILNLFQVNMKQISSGERQPKLHYQAYEETVEGDCETSYTIVPNKQQRQQSVSSSSSPQLNITKSINFRNCRHRPHIHYDFPSAQKCFEGKDDKSKIAEDKLIQGFSISSYSVAKNSDSFVIHEAKTTSQYVYAPFGDQTDQISASVKQKITLSSSSAGEQINEPKNPKPSETGNVYSFEWDAAQEKLVMFGRPEHVKKLNGDNNPAKYLTNKLASFMVSVHQSSGDSGDSAKNSWANGGGGASTKTKELLRLTDVLRHADWKDLEQLDAQIGRTVQGDKEKETMVDLFYAQLLAICGTKVCVQRLDAMIKQRKLSEPAWLLVTKQLFNMQIPSEDLLKELLGVANRLQEQKSHTFYFTRQMLWLLAGSMINSLCSHSQNKYAIEQLPQQKRVCPPSIKQLFVQTIAKHLSASHKWEDKLIFTKALSNAGLPESLPLLEKLIKNKNNDLSWLRNSAIFALKNLARKRPEYVRGLLMPIASGPKEPTEIRLSAIKILLESKPDVSTLTHLARLTSTDQNGQVSSFIYSALVTISNSTKICDRSLIHNARLAVPSLAPGSKGSSESSFLDWLSMDDAEHEVALDVELLQLYGNETGNGQNRNQQQQQLPKHLSIGWNSLWAGLYQKNQLALGLVSTDPDNILHEGYKSMLGGANVKGRKGRYLQEIWSRGFQNLPDDDDEQEEEDHDEPEEDSERGEGDYRRSEKDHFGNSASKGRSPFRAIVYAQLKDQNVAFLPVNKNLLKKYVRHLKPQFGKWAKELSSGKEFGFGLVTLDRDTFVKVPTSAGVPFSVSIRAPTVTSVKGRAQQERGNNRPSTQIQLDVKSQLEASTVIDVKIWTPIVDHGFTVENTVQLNTPIAGSVAVESAGKTQTVKFVSKLPSQDLAKVKVRPFTYANPWPDFIKDFDNVQEKPIPIRPANMEKKCFGEPFSGTKVCLHKTGETPILINSLKPAYLSLAVKPDQNGCQQVEVTASVTQSSTGGGGHSPDISRMAKVKVDTKCGQHRANLNAATLVDPRKNFVKFQAVLKSGDERRSTTACLDGEMMYLNKAKRLVVGNSALKWGGKSCDSAQNQIVAKLTSDKNPPSFTPSNKNTNQNEGTCSRLGQCRQSQSPSELNTYHLKVDYRCPVQFRNITNKAYQMFKHGVYDKSDVAQIDVKNKPNHISAVLSITKADPVGNLVVKSPGENLTVFDLNLPSWFDQLPVEQGSNQPSPDHWTEKPHQKYNPNFNPDHDHAEGDIEEEDEYHNFSPDEDDQYDRENEGDQDHHQFTFPEDSDEEHDEDNFPNNDDDDEHERPKKQQQHHHKVKNVPPPPPVKRARPPKIKVLKREKSGLVESSSWTSSETDSEIEIIPDSGEEKPVKKNGKEQKKPRWGDWLNENPSKQIGHAKRKYGRDESNKFDEDRSNKQQENTCQLDQNDKITTLTKKQYSFPVTKCYAILSKDCTPNRRFIVMVKKSDQAPNAKDLFVLIRTHKILVQIVDQQARARINDAPVELKDGMETYAPGSKTTKLKKKGSEVIIDIQELGIQVRFDGRNVAITFSDKISREQCGLCGQPNNKNWPDTSKANFRDQLYAHYVIKDARCQSAAPPKFSEKTRPSDISPAGQKVKSDAADFPSPPQRGDSMGKFRNPYNEDTLLHKSKDSSGFDDFDKYSHETSDYDHSDEEEEEDRSSNYEEQGHKTPCKPTAGKACPKSGHKMFEVADKVCITIHTVSKCPENAYAEHQTKESTPLWCVNSNEPKAAELKRLIHQRPYEPLPELRGMEPNQYYPVLVPSKCIKY